MWFSLLSILQYVVHCQKICPVFLISTKSLENVCKDSFEKLNIVGWMKDNRIFPFSHLLRVMVLNLKTNKQQNKHPCLLHSYLVIIFLWNPLTLCKNKPTIFLFNHMIIAKILRMKWKNVSFSWKLLPKV